MNLSDVAMGAGHTKPGMTGKISKAKELAAIKKHFNPTGEHDTHGNLTAGSVIGVGIDLDAGIMWWRVNTDEILQPFATVSTGITDGVHPAVGGNAGPNNDSDLAVNLGRSPFRFEPPMGYCPIEDPMCESATWLGRFEHSADVTKALLLRQPLSSDVIAMAFDREKAASETRDIKLEVVKTDMPRYGQGNPFNVQVPNPPENLLTEDQGQVWCLLTFRCSVCSPLCDDSTPKSCLLHVDGMVCVFLCVVCCCFCILAAIPSSVGAACTRCVPRARQRCGQHVPSH